MLKQILTIIAVSASVTATAADLPKRKSGLWEVTNISSAQGKGDPSAMIMSMCVDQNSDADWLKQGQQIKCSKEDFKVERDRLTFSSVCNFGNTTATSKGVASGDFNKAYTVETHSTYDPPMAGLKEASNKITAKWLGPCKAGQRAGDVIMPNGTTINMNDLMKIKK